MELFGWKFGKQKDKKEVLKTFQLDQDAATDIVGVSGNGLIAQDFNLVTIPESEVELINTYRRIANSADIDLALTEIRNEVFVFDVIGKRAVELGFLPDCTIKVPTQEKIREEFVNIYNILDFQNNGLNLFMDWYIDGRLFLYKILDGDNTKKGIRKIIPIDPLKIKKIREIPNPDSDGTVDMNKIIEYYVYVERYDDLNSMSKVRLGATGLRISPDAIAYCDSGMYDKKTNCVIGFLYKSIGPYNNLKLMEDSLIIYRVVRAPERRVIYVDVGNLPKNKAEQYVHDMMNRFKTKLVYDSRTGNIVDRKNILSMVEDFWLPRRDGKGTEIETLPGGENLGVTEDVEYFRNKLHSSMGVPSARFSAESQTPFAFGKGTEIDRDEYRFKKYIDRLRQRFMFIFENLLKSQLLLKNIIVESDWETIRNGIQWVFTEDNNFVEYKEAEMLANRVTMIESIDPFVGTGNGKYFDRNWVLKNILKYSDSQIEKMNTPSQDDISEEE